MHGIVGASQPDANTRWTAAATMTMGGNVSVGSGGATLLTDPGVRDPPGAGLDNVETFVRSLE